MYIFKLKIDFFIFLIKNFSKYFIKNLKLIHSYHL